MQQKQEAGLSAAAADKYRARLYALYNWLGDNKALSAGRLQQWRQSLQQQGYSKSTLQNHVKAVNSYLRAVGLEQLCIPKPLRYDLTGRTFGYLTVMGISEERRSKKILWQCRCKCGKEIEVATAQLLNGQTTSCGCLSTEILQHHNRYVDGTELRQALDDTVRNPNSKSGYVGVQPKGDKWTACITYKKVKYHLGTYYKLEDAIKARARAKELVMEDAKRLYDETAELFTHKPARPPKPEKAKLIMAEPTGKKATRSDNTSGCTGVTKQYGKWNASISAAGHRYKLGAYDELDDAIAVRKYAEQLLADGKLEELRQISTNKK